MLSSSTIRPWISPSADIHSSSLLFKEEDFSCRPRSICNALANAADLSCSASRVVGMFCSCCSLFMLPSLVLFCLALSFSVSLETFFNFSQLFVPRAWIHSFSNCSSDNPSRSASSSMVVSCLLTILLKTVVPLNLPLCFSKLSPPLGKIFLLYHTFPDISIVMSTVFFLG